MLTKENEAFINGIITGAAGAALAAVIVSAFIGPAHADGLAIMSTGPRGTHTTIIAPLGSAEPHIIHIPQSMDPERDERVRKWEAFCDPKTVRGPYGVERYVYAHKDCEYGRSE